MRWLVSFQGMPPTGFVLVGGVLIFMNCRNRTCRAAVPSVLCFHKKGQMYGY
jgi:hypothetical protein